MTRRITPQEIEQALRPHVTSGKTGWPSPVLAQDDNHPLFRWFAERMNSRQHVRDNTPEPTERK